MKCDKCIHFTSEGRSIKHETDSRMMVYSLSNCELFKTSTFNVLKSQDVDFKRDCDYVDDKCEINNKGKEYLMELKL